MTQRVPSPSCNSPQGCKNAIWNLPKIIFCLCLLTATWIGRFPQGENRKSHQLHFISYWPALASLQFAPLIFPTKCVDVCVCVFCDRVFWSLFACVCIPPILLSPVSVNPLREKVLCFLKCDVLKPEEKFRSSPLISRVVNTHLNNYTHSLLSSVSLNAFPAYINGSSTQTLP